MTQAQAMPNRAAASRTPSSSASAFAGSAEINARVMLTATNNAPSAGPLTGAKA